VIPWLSDSGTDFPPTRLALGEGSPAPGLLAAGGRLSVERLRAAYSQGIFPWFSEGEPPLWWSPAPRMVLKTADFRLSRSMRRTLQRFVADPGCAVTIDRDCPAVIRACAAAPRAGQDGTWIVEPMQAAYAAWHAAGEVHAFETWIGGERVGGLYGVALGRMFFGESMFAQRTDASKIALAALVAFCREHGIEWIDCQQQTRHLASFGAAPVGRDAFEHHLSRVTAAPAVDDWTYDPRLWRHVLPAPVTAEHA
jgi:leucyl/phenylalanyl-tRNA--protein transferase